MTRCRRSIVVLPFAATLLAAGCGGGGGNAPGVASVASGTTGAATPSPPVSASSQKPFGPSSGPQFQIAMKVPSGADGTRFSGCMRKHGVAGFPDPDSQGVIRLHSGMGIDPGSPAFQSARKACAKLLPNGGQPTAAQEAQMQQKLLAFSKCMRAHGVKDFPDPSGGGLRIHVQPGGDLQPGNQTFQAAQKACQGDLPLKGGG